MLDQNGLTYFITIKDKSIEVYPFVAICKEAILMNEIHFHSPESVLFRIIPLSLK